MPEDEDEEDDEEEEEKSPSSSPAHASTQWAGCADDSHQLPQHFHPCSSTTLCRVCRDQKCHNTHTHSYTQSYPGLHRPPSCLAELPVYAKDNWPNGLSLPLWLDKERGSFSPPASEYWLVALLVIWLFEQSSPLDPWTEELSVYCVHLEREPALRCVLRDV